MIPPEVTDGDNPERLRIALNAQFNPAQWPVIHDIAQQNNSLVLGIEVASDLIWFEGHFPDNPVLPGVVQVHWAVSLARQLLVPGATFQRVENLKFKSVVLPGMRLRLEFQIMVPGEKVWFAFYNGSTGDVHSEGRLTFI